MKAKLYALLIAATPLPTTGAFGQDLSQMICQAPQQHFLRTFENVRGDASGAEFAAWSTIAGTRYMSSEAQKKIEERCKDPLIGICLIAIEQAQCKSAQERKCIPWTEVTKRKAQCKFFRQDWTKVPRLRTN